MKAILFTGLLICAVNLAIASTDRPDLSGQVLGENGTPMAKATVFVYSAGPKQGTASLCPYCYADCRKKAETDGDGRFKIESLDPELRFRLLVVASGHESQFVRGVDPVTGEPQRISLKAIDPNDLKSGMRIVGRIIGEDGKPVIGAVVGPEGVQRGTSTQWGGTDSFVDPVAVADGKGQFSLLCKKEVTTVHAVIEGPNVAKCWVQLKPGRDHLVRMQEGVTVTGRIEQNGKPLKDVLVGVSTTDRTCGSYFHCDELATDKDGQFLIPNVPPGREFVLFSTMASLRGQGFTPGKVITTGKSRTTLDVGSVPVQAGHRLTGRIVLSDGLPVPLNTRLLLSREKAWDHTEAELDLNGNFEFSGVPPEPVGLNVRINGYKFSKRNPSLDRLNGGLVGTVDADSKELTLLLEPGEWKYNGEEDPDFPASGDTQPYSKPLRGVKR